MHSAMQGVHHGEALMGSSRAFCYTPPAAKPVPPVPPGIADGSDITAPDSVCYQLTYANELRHMSGEELCAACFGRLAAAGEIPVRLKACGENFHLRCLRGAMNLRSLHKCPSCDMALVPVKGNVMPAGQMICARDPISCAGYERHGSIVIQYSIQTGRQRSDHPNPGQYHGALSSRAYLPDNSEGKELLCRLVASFVCGRAFRIEKRSNRIVWNIGHKLLPGGGTAHDGYPDPNYLANCNVELSMAGVPSFNICSLSIKNYYPGEMARSVTTANPCTTQNPYTSAFKLPSQKAAAVFSTLKTYRAHQTRRVTETGPIHYEKPALSIFTTVGGARMCQMQSVLNSVGSSDFIQFVEKSHLVNPSVELNPHLYSGRKYESFIEEGFNCTGEEKHHVRVVFHGTPEENIEPILQNGLDPAFRKRQAFGQGEYFARNPAMPTGYAHGCKKILVFAVIATDTDNRSRDIIVVENGRRQLPIATLSFESLGSFAARHAASFQGQVSVLLAEKQKKEKLAKEAKQKEDILQRILEREYESASCIYNKACDADGKPPHSWAGEVAMYVHDHLRDEVFIEIYFPNLPPRPTLSTVKIFNRKQCEADADAARRAYEASSTAIGQMQTGAPAPSAP